MAHLLHVLLLVNKKVAVGVVVLLEPLKLLLDLGLLAIEVLILFGDVVCNLGLGLELAELDLHLFYFVHEDGVGLLCCFQFISLPLVADLLLIEFLLDLDIGLFQTIQL